MAKLMAGILGNISGKVSGVVGAVWKGRAYIRAYAKPGNPNTGPQQIQRSAMAHAVQAAKPFVAMICNAYTDKFVKGMSGFNWIVKNCIKRISGSDPLKLLQVSAGPLFPAHITSATCNSTTGNVAIEWSPDLGVDGLDTDTVVVWARNTATNQVWFYDGNWTRADGAVAITIPTGMFWSDIEAGTMAAQMKPNSPTIVNKISNSYVVNTTIAS